MRFMRVVFMIGRFRTNKIEDEDIFGIEPSLTPIKS